MDSCFYKILRKKNSIEANVYHLIFKVFINEKIKVKTIITTIIYISISAGISIVLERCNNTMNLFSSLLTDAFTFSVGITSFLIAACTIFFTLIKSETSYVFLLINDSNSRESKFKTILYNFIKPIIYFIFLIVYNFIFKISYQIVISLYVNVNVYLAIKYIAIYTLIYLLIRSIVELLYLVYNIYSFVLMINLENVAMKELIANGFTYEKYIEDLENKLHSKYMKRRYK
ncbi:hypothetical protein [Candidatus Clostridium stratigraminis]|uniref:Uncharacterized protein n=1 Tax=Candidatus Clostridium stratigraminis TaxID=3381661 RepID=A0ABW8T1S3_9CLOT